MRTRFYDFIMNKIETYSVYFIKILFTSVPDKTRISIQVFTLGSTSGTSSSFPSMLHWLTMLEQWVLPKASVEGLSFVEKPFFDIHVCLFVCLFVCFLTSLRQLYCRKLVHLSWRYSVFHFRISYVYLFRH